MAMLLAVVTLLSVGTLSYAVSNFTTRSQFTGKTYTHYGTYAGMQVKDMIDVSEHNGLINWYKIKALGIDDAIIRVGYRGYGKAGNMVEDKYYYDNIESAIEAGVNVGLYFYSQSLNTTESIAEANFVLKRVKNYKITLPIFFDYEFAEVSDGRLDAAWNSGKLNKAKMTANVIAFCDTIKKAGYKAGIYSSSGFYTYQYNADNFLNKGYEFWNAYYTTNSTSGSFWPNKNHVYKYWQYAGGNVQGSCGEPTSAWIKVKYGGKTGYVSARYFDFTASQAAKLLGSAGLYTGAGSGLIQTIAAGSKVTILEYPTKTNTDLNFYYFTGKPAFSLSATQNSVRVSWNKMSGMSYYRVYSYDKTAKTYTRLAETTGTSYTATGLKKLGTYTYLVRAFNAAGEGTPYTVSDNKSIMTATDKPVFKADNITGSSIRLVWNKVSGAAFYRVYSYNTSTKKYTRLAQTKDLTFTLTGLKNNTACALLVRAFNATQTGSAYTLQDVLSVKSTPAAPQFHLQSYSYSVKINWNAVAGADFYRVYAYDAASKKYTRLMQTTDTAWEHGPIKANTSYTYLVRAFQKSGYGSDYTAKLHQSISTMPAKPQLSVRLNEKNIQLSWAKIAGAAYYRVYLYDTQSGKYTRVAQTTALSYPYSPITGGTEYVFLVRAFKANGDGSTFSAANHKSIIVPLQKAVFTLASEKKGSVTVRWNAVPYAAFYRVYEYDALSGKYQRLCQVKTLSYTLNGLTSGESRTYLVRAFNENYIAADYNAQTDNQSILVM